MSRRIELAIEKMNHGHWLRVTIPYATTLEMTASLQNRKGEMLRQVRLLSGNNLIDLEALGQQTLQIQIDTPFEILSREIQPA